MMVRSPYLVINIRNKSLSKSQSFAKKLTYKEEIKCTTIIIVM